MLSVIPLKVKSKNLIFIPQISKMYQVTCIAY